MLGTFVSVFVSFFASISIIGKGGNLLYIILLFIVFFVVLFLPLSFAARPMIEMDAIRKYIDKMDEKVKKWSFNKDDMKNMRRLRKLIIEKDKRSYLALLARVVYIMSEMEKIERAKTSFYWEDQSDVLH
jgi:membrane protein insertase Oxa1/YidC/SpoIIIJ